MTKQIGFLFVLLLITVGCGKASSSQEQPADSISNSYVDCISSDHYVITKDNVNKPVSPYNIYFYVLGEGNTAYKTIRLIIKADSPILLVDGKPDPRNQILPTWYEWHLVYAHPSSWYMNLLKDTNDVHYMSLNLSQQDWRYSSLCAYFKDINNDGIDDNLAFRIIISDFVELPDTAEDKISAFINAIADGDQAQALAEWYLSDFDDEKKKQLLEVRKEEIIANLLAAKIQPKYDLIAEEGWVGNKNYPITSIEWAWLARIKVNLTDGNGTVSPYIFDIVNRSYDTVQDYYMRDWVVVDVYPEGEQPYYFNQP